MYHTRVSNTPTPPKTMQESFHGNQNNTGILHGHFCCFFRPELKLPSNTLDQFSQSVYPATNKLWAAPIKQAGPSGPSGEWWSRRTPKAILWRPSAFVLGRAQCRRVWISKSDEKRPCNFLFTNWAAIFESP